ncbi:transmembrane protein 62-like [Ptychodera flava]|uniref:transmembrane protein 62-like n=1 Tax=Ptychodera flava TaxID=63121 RepID=UPI00396A552D
METFEIDESPANQAAMRRRRQICIGFLLLAAVGAVCGCIAAWRYFTKPEESGSETRIGHPKDHKPPYPGSSPDNLWWFIQISDIHLNEFNGKERYHQFWHFCSSYVDIIQPSLVLVTGDLTDALHGKRSSQNEMEWEMYKKCLEDSGVLKKTLWLDIRGNHDIFNVPSADSEKNFYRKYSYLGKKGETNFVHSQNFSFGTYSFIYVGALPMPAPKLPFNFFGVLDKNDLKSVEDLTNQTRASNSTIYFSHYPTSFIVSRNPGLSTITKNGIAFLSGHLHDIYGDVPDLTIIQRSGTLELELVDWKDNRKFRILAFDHDLLSFVDATYGHWPVILITNPKNARYLAPKHEPLTRMQHATHIRFLVFSSTEMRSAKVFIDDKPLGEAEHVKGPLYVLKWNPSLYLNGLHRISIQTQDVMGHKSSQSQLFSLDGSRPNQSLVSSVILMTDIEKMLKVCFAIGFILTFGPLILLRIFTRPTTISFLCIPFAKLPLLRGLLWLAHINILFIIIMLLGLLILIGPWFIGELVDGYVGFVFLYGAYINGSILPDPITYKEATYDMMHFLVPFIFHLALQVELFFPLCNQLSLIKCQRKVLQRSSWWLKFLISQLFFVFALKRQIGYSRFLYRGYGTMALFLSPKYLWTALMMVVVYFALYVTYYCRRKRQAARL